MNRQVKLVINIGVLNLMLDEQTQKDAKNKATEWANSQRLECPNCGLINKVVVQDVSPSRQYPYNKKEGHGERLLPDIPVVPIVCSGCGTTVKYYDEPVNTV